MLEDAHKHANGEDAMRPQHSAPTSPLATSASTATTATYEPATSEGAYTGRAPTSGTADDPQRAMDDIAEEVQALRPRTAPGQVLDNTGLPPLHASTHSMSFNRYADPPMPAEALLQNRPADLPTLHVSASPATYDSQAGTPTMGSQMKQAVKSVAPRRVAQRVAEKLRPSSHGEAAPSSTGRAKSEGTPVRLRASARALPALLARRCAALMGLSICAHAVILAHMTCILQSIRAWSIDMFDPCKLLQQCQSKLTTMVELCCSLVACLHPSRAHLRALYSLFLGVTNSLSIVGTDVLALMMLRGPHAAGSPVSERNSQSSTASTLRSSATAPVRKTSMFKKLRRKTATTTSPVHSPAVAQSSPGGASTSASESQIGEAGGNGHTGRRKIKHFFRRCTDT